MKETEELKQIREDLKEVSLLLSAMREDHPLYDHIKNQKIKLEWKLAHEEIKDVKE